jgi:hypothetical protein
MTRRLSMTPKAVWMRAYRRQKRRELIQLLGGVCADCGGTKNLEPHHTGPRTWVSRNIWSNQRLRRYIEEAAAGLVELLCSDCNKINGKPASHPDNNF